MSCECTENYHCSDCRDYARALSPMFNVSMEHGRLILGHIKGHTTLTLVLQDDKMSVGQAEHLSSWIDAIMPGECECP
jgi:hypothetical protein